MAQTQAGLDAEINLQLLDGGDITAAQLRLVLHDMNAGIFQTTITGFASPTAVAGLTAVNGAASTAMRSDAAPALDQTVAPTWTGQHSFANATASTAPGNGAVTVAGGVGITGALNIGGAARVGGSIYTNSAPLQAAQRLTGTVSATGSTDLSFTVPAGATVLGMTTYTTTGFGASGAVTLQGGSAVGDSSYFSATSIKALGVVDMTLTGAGQGSIPAGSPNYFVRITQAGTPSATGSAILVLDYLVP